MMSAEFVLNAISLAANKSLAINCIMHVLVLGALLVLFFSSNLKLKRYVFDGVLFILTAGVAVVSMVIGNPFNFVMFAAIAIISLVELVQGRNQLSRPGLNFNTIISLVFIIIGFCYPEFVKADALALLVVSPLGAIPCPTLLVCLGMLNLAVPQVNKIQYVGMVVFAIFYGLIGVFLLKVYLDIALLVLVVYSLYNLRFVFGRKKLL